MTPAAHDQLAILAEQRAKLESERRRIEKAYSLAVLDHISAKIRAACPEAVYVNFAYCSSGAIDLHSVLGAQPSPLGTCPELWDNRRGEEKHPLDYIGDQIESDIQTVLAPFSSLAWASVHVNSAADGNSWLLELPPADRAARVAELVRVHHPQATAVIVDGRRIIEIVEGSAEDGTQNLTTLRRWPNECEKVLTRLVGEIFAMPSLAGRYLTSLHRYRHPYGASSDLVRLMTLPPTS